VPRRKTCSSCGRDQEFQRFLLEHEIKLAEVDAGDRASAREREKALRHWTPSVLAAVVTGGFFVVIAYLLRYGLPDSGAEPALILLGALGGGFATVLSYYFGSSSLSRKKDDVLASRQH
jgi:hypothetical protein